MLMNFTFFRDDLIQPFLSIIRITCLILNLNIKLYFHIFAIPTLLFGGLFFVFMRAFFCL